ncbi:uncharacterized protein Bfra_002426 [Botrytis fragariae]|uniref:Uncharacterized protein n=1 Tax=Botrytis fragariae TaxID=1964551 RepID=A0A8H6AYM4_9HELO|nr:uncharacterized protein Bfra_002426 [Botrytis fragariae]KAF5876028.1 hypothetical protein Bfra_002426 [Botrytis fragariae]
MREEGWEEEELIEGSPQIPNFKAFKLAKFEAKDKSERLAKIEIWEESMKRGKARKQCMGSVEGAACTRNVQEELPLVSSTPSPLSQDSICNNRQEPVAPETSGWTEEEKEQAIHNGIYGDAYGDIYGDVYWDTNVDIHEENLVSESLSRTRRKKSNRSKQRKKAAERQASLQIHGLLPVPLPPQPLQEQFNRTVSQHDSVALRPKSNNNQLEVRGQKAGREMTMGRFSSEGLTLQQDRLKQIADLRKRIIARKALLQAQGLLPVSPSRQNVIENFIRTLRDGNSEAKIFNPLNIQEDENRQKTPEIMGSENLGSGASPQKKDSNQHITKSPKTYQGKYTTSEKEREPSTSIPDEIRVLLQREKERRQRLSALDNVELVEKREQEQELSVSERIRLSIENTKSRSVPTKICDVSEKTHLEIVKKRAALSDQGSSLYAPAAPQKPWHNSSSVLRNESREVLQLDEQGNHAMEGAQDGELLPVLKDAGFLPENLDMEIDTVIEHGDQEDIAKLVSIPQNIGVILDNARRSIPEMLSQLLFPSEEVEEIMKMENEWFGWLGMDADIDTDIEDWINVTTPSPKPPIEHASEDITLRATPDTLSELFNISEDIEDMVNTENEWFGWLGMDIDVEDFADGFARC